MIRETHPLAGKTVRLKLATGAGSLPENWGSRPFRVEDWWVNVCGKPWHKMVGMDSSSAVNPACVDYGLRMWLAGMPFDDDVVYGFVGGQARLVHASEIGGLEWTETSGLADVDFPAWILNVRRKLRAWAEKRLTRKAPLIGSLPKQP